MAINRFAIMTDGWDKPGTGDWTVKKYRALAITMGYLNRALGEAIISGFLRFWDR